MPSSLYAGSGRRCVARSVGAARQAPHEQAARPAPCGRGARQPLQWAASSAASGGGAGFSRRFPRTAGPGLAGGRRCGLGSGGGVADATGSATAGSATTAGSVTAAGSATVAGAAAIGILHRRMRRARGCPRGDDAPRWSRIANHRLLSRAPIQGPQAEISDLEGERAGDDADADHARSRFRRRDARTRTRNRSTMRGRSLRRQLPGAGQRSSAGSRRRQPARPGQKGPSPAICRVDR